MGEVSRKANAYDAEADDYGTKPVHMEKLKLRIRTLRRDLPAGAER